MAAYKDLVGQKITKVTSNPGEPKTGQMWYNSTDGKLKGLGILEAWSSASPLIVARDKPGNAGTQTAALTFGGTGALVSAAEYNGTGWKVAPNLNTGREGMGSGGTTSAAWKAGGNPPATTNATEEYDGSSWTTVPGTLNSGRYILGSCGTQTAGLCCGGYNGSSNNNESEEYNGTAWSEGNNLNTSRRTLTTFGIQTAAIAVGGQTPSLTTATESYDGTSWTTSPATYPVAFSDGSSTGTQTAGLIFGGYTSPAPVTTTTNKFNGTTYSSAPSMGTATARGAAAGSQSATLAFGGTSPNPGTVVEEFNVSTNAITAAAWGTGGAMNTGRSLMGSFGTRTAAVGVAGLKNPYATYSNDTEKYDGTSWTASGNYPQSIYSVGSAGTSTAGLAFGGILPGSSSNTTCEFDGSTWTAQGSPGNVPVSGGYSNGFGTQTAAIANLPGASTTIAYDGSSWTAYGSPGNMNTGRLDGYGQNGTSTAGLVVAGRTAPGPTNTTNTEEWNGSTWSASGAYPTAMVFVQSNGTQTAAAGAGGDKMPGEAAQTTTCTYDGSTWATAPNLGTAVSRHGGANGAPSTQGTIYSGNIPGITTTQEFTAETSAANITDFTTS